MLALRFQIGPHRLALDVRQVKEVVPRVELRPAGPGLPWLAGVFIYRGRVVPVVDLHRLLGCGECPAHLSSRIILVPSGEPDSEQLIGLLAAQVADVRSLDPPELPTTRRIPSEQPDLGPVMADGSQVMHLLNPELLLPSSARQQLLGLAVELAP